MRSWIFVLLLVMAGPAEAAEDFTGFYAGVNAGYALGSTGRAAALAIPAGAVAAAIANGELPPSARDAAERLANRRPADRAPAPR